MGWQHYSNIPKQITMKTAMQELIEDLQKEFGNRLKEDAFIPFLEKEKEQIIAARNSKEIESIEAWDFATDIMSKGVSNKPNNLGRSAEDYYKQTYNSNK